MRRFRQSADAQRPRPTVITQKHGKAFRAAVAEEDWKRLKRAEKAFRGRVWRVMRAMKVGARQRRIR